MPALIIAGLALGGFVAIMGAWMVLALVGAFVIRKLRQRARDSATNDRAIPISLVCIITGPIVGAILGGVSTLAHRNRIELFELRNDLLVIVTCSSFAGLLAAIVFGFTVRAR